MSYARPIKGNENAHRSPLAERLKELFRLKTCGDYYDRLEANIARSAPARKERRAA